jgi:hypothetical protein
MSVPIKVEIICVEMEKSRIAVLTLFKGISKIKDGLPCDRDNSELVTRDKSLRKCLLSSRNCSSFATSANSANSANSVNHVDLLSSVSFDTKCKSSRLGGEHGTLRSAITFNAYNWVDFYTKVKKWKN